MTRITSAGWGVREAIAKSATTGAQLSVVMLANTMLSGNATGALASGAAAGTIFSYGNNAVNDNGSPGVAPTVVALK